MLTLRNAICLLILCLLLTACGSESDSTDRSAPGKNSPPTIKIVNGELDLGAGKILVTESLDESRYNNVNPKGLTSEVRAVLAHAPFKTDANTFILIDPDYQNFYCENGTRPTVSFALTEAGKTRSVKARERVVVSPYTDYLLQIRFDRMNCTGEFSFWFGFRAGN